MSAADGILRCADIDLQDARALLAEHALELLQIGRDEPLPGCFWGAPEAGIVGNRVFIRADTPVHSMLHESCHLIVLSPNARAHVHTDASDCQQEEDATCYLQLVLADRICGFGFVRACADMDRWGYTFRLGSARAWFEQDAEDARAFLERRGLLAAIDLPVLASAAAAD